VWQAWRRHICTVSLSLPGVTTPGARCDYRCDYTCTASRSVRGPAPAAVNRSPPTFTHRPLDVRRTLQSSLSIYLLTVRVTWPFQEFRPSPRNISGSRLKLETLNLVGCSQHICEVLPWDDELSPKWAWSGTPHAVTRDPFQKNWAT